MSDETRFHGWTNRETWATVSHLDNTEWMQDAAMDRALTYGDIEQWITEAHELMFYPAPGDPDVPEDMRNLLADVGSLYRVEWAEVENHFRDMAEED